MRQICKIHVLYCVDFILCGICHNRCDLKLWLWSTFHLRQSPNAGQICTGMIYEYLAWLHSDTRSVQSFRSFYFCQKQQKTNLLQSTVQRRQYAMVRLIFHRKNNITQSLQSNILTLKFDLEKNIYHRIFVLLGKYSNACRRCFAEHHYMLNTLQ